MNERQARVLTLHEAAAAESVCVEMWEPLWFSKPVTTQAKVVYNGGNMARIERGVRDYMNWPVAEYGMSWRCWDKKPTDEESIAVKWEEAQWSS